jgi:hypothetical protein
MKKVGEGSKEHSPAAAKMGEKGTITQHQCGIENFEGLRCAPLYILKLHSFKCLPLKLDETRNVTKSKSGYIKRQRRGKALEGRKGKERIRGKRGGAEIGAKRARGREHA